MKSLLSNVLEGLVTKYMEAELVQTWRSGLHRDCGLTPQSRCRKRDGGGGDVSWPLSTPTWSVILKKLSLSVFLGLKGRLGLCILLRIQQ